MKLPRQPEIVSIVVTCAHEGDCIDAKDLVVKYLESRFDHVQSWTVSSNQATEAFTYIIRCYPRAVND